MEKEERKRKEQADKKLLEFASRRPKDMPPTKEELKIKEREDEVRKIKEQEELAKRQKEETEQVRKEVFEYRKAIDEM